MKKTAQYFMKHPGMNALAHFLGGTGVGILLTRAVFDPHPMRWGIGLIALAVIIHIYPLTLKK
jgi:nucleoside recognition membrane protein YjiH